MMTTTRRWVWCLMVGVSSVARADWWQDNCNETAIQRENSERNLTRCLIFTLQNSMQAMKNYVGELDLKRRLDDALLTDTSSALMSEDAEMARAYHFMEEGISSSDDLPGLGDVTYDGSTQLPSEVSSRAIELRISERLALQTQAALSRKNTSAIADYFSTVFPNYCGRDWTETGHALAYCAGGPQAFANFDTMASSLLGPVRYNNKSMANSYAWLNHNNWVSTSLDGSDWSSGSNRLTLWESNPQNFAQTAQDFIQTLIQPVGSGLPSVLFKTTTVDGTSQHELTDDGKEYMVVVRRASAMRSLAYNSLYHAYYQRYTEDNFLESPMSILDKEVAKRFGGKSDYCVQRDIHDNNACTQTGSFHDLMASLPTQDVIKEMASMMALDLKLRYLQYQQNERIELLLAAQLGVVADQLEAVVKARADVEENTSVSSINTKLSEAGVDPVATDFSG